MTRTSWEEHFTELAKFTASRSTCLKVQHGAALVRDKRVLAIGFNGSPEGIEHCVICRRAGLPSGEHPEWCRATHAEQNAIINAARIGVSTVGSVLYVTGGPCLLCIKMLINAGVLRIVCPDGKFSPVDLFQKYDRELEFMR